MCTLCSIAKQLIWLLTGIEKHEKRLVPIQAGQHFLHYGYHTLCHREQLQQEMSSLQLMEASISYYPVVDCYAKLICFGVHGNHGFDRTHLAGSRMRSNTNAL